MGRVIPAYDAIPDRPAAAPLGLPMCQNRLAVPTWSYAMERYPPARVIEIGTYSGGFACALGVHAWRIRARFVTVDRNAPDESLAHLMRALGIEFRLGDLWGMEDALGALIQEPGVSYVLCDGGDKPRELATFARFLKPGDVIAAHDYAAVDEAGRADAWWGCGEIRKEQGDAAAADSGLEPWMQDHFDTAAWLAYRRPSQEAASRVGDLR